MKNFLLFITSFLFFGALVALPYLVSAGTITELWSEKYSKITFGYVEDGMFKFKDGFDTYPRNIIIDKVVIPDTSQKYREVVGVQVIEL